MTPVSVTGMGVLVVSIETLLKIFGVEFPEGSVASAVNATVTLIGFIMLLYGQLNRKDLHYGLIRKS